MTTEKELAKLEALKKKLAQAEAALEQKQARERAQQDKVLTRKKILIGAFALECIGRDPNFKIIDLAWGESTFERFLTRSADRKLFGFDVASAPDAALPGSETGSTPN